MTIFKACSINDTKAEAWTQPFFVRSNGAAVRSFADACRSDTTEYGKHPEDYHLYVIGEFDEDTGVLTAIDPVHLIHGANVGDIT